MTILPDESAGSFSEPRDLGLFSILDEATRRSPDSVYLVDGSGSLTYLEAHGRVRSLASYWRRMGVSRGDRIVVCCQNRSEIAIAIFATALLGASYIVANSKLRPHGLAKILNQAEPSAFVADAETYALFDSAKAPKSNLLVGDSIDGCDWDSFDRAVQFDAPLEVDWPGIDVDPVCLVFTSGSTADPRGVTLSHDNIRFVTAAIQARLNYRSTDVVGCFLPMAFDYGLYQVFLSARAGATLFIGDPGQVGPRLPGILERAGISVLPGVPTVYGALIAMFERRPFKLSRLRAITNTGERLPIAYIEKMEAMVPGLEVYPMYGLTECKRVSILTDRERKQHPNSVGRPLDGTEVFAVSPEGERLPGGSVGELVVRGRHIAHGYWRAPEETAKRFRKRSPESAVELFTGDYGSVDEDGYIYFASRADDQLKHRGNRISPAEIEMEACASRGVVEACLLKRQSDDSLHLFVTVSDLTMTPMDIADDLAGKLESFKVPDVIHIEPLLPKSLNSKVDRKALMQKLETEQNYRQNEPVAQTAS